MSEEMRARLIAAVEAASEGLYFPHEGPARKLVIAEPGKIADALFTALAAQKEPA